jgi:alkane 1-monooxygenase
MTTVEQVRRGGAARLLAAAPYYLSFLTPLSVVHGFQLGGLWSYQTIVWVYGIIPLIDWCVGLDKGNLSEDEAAARERSLAFKLPLWLFVPLQLGLIVWALGMVAEGGASLLEIFGLTISLGIATGAIGITVAHELMHRRSALERALAEALMASVSYTHFCIEHVRGHHRNVATPADPATARLGESFYAFWPRCVAGGLGSAWRLEVERLGRRGLAVWGPGNAMLRYGATLIVVYGAVAAAFGASGVLVFAIQGVIAFSMLEAINYIEHYGLSRRELSPGHYEPVAPEHSWNSSHRVTNWFLFDLARHTDHHLNAGRRYPALRHIDSPTQLPAGYAAMFVLALVPPLWRAVMDRRATAREITA